ncbi:histone deacetylase [Desulfosarcina ovata]|uniref:Histone deacetylase domain-containing protein n=1 Tax=Desulfosarcina ovata subsp. ovata TaxID=2752305 RepID=A0A5K8ACV6_9BACT|nr:histone deacetylase [Desulfosarcina ovata]BBO90553.1 hypothetical protein DSCOOX_37330 [Desulfosarcina ovata subsp. ovata]
MIKREHIQLALDAIHHVDRESGYGLQALFDDQRIRIAPDSGGQTEDSEGKGFLYYFEGERVDVPKTAFVADGIATLEQSLVFKWGELREKQLRVGTWISGNIHQLAGDIRRAGAELQVDYELQRLKNRPANLEASVALPAAQSPGPHFSGHLVAGMPAQFVPLPLTRQMLLQVAGQRFEFFSVRFLLDSWADGSFPFIYACIAGGQLLGLVKLQRHRHAINDRFEIKYIARRAPQYDDTETSARGVGTFMLAGVWMLWHTFAPDVRHIFLDGEVGARKFYLDAGFTEQRLCRYVLETPAGYLLATIADMADDPRAPAGTVKDRLESLIRTSIKELGRARRGRRNPEPLLAFIKRCLVCRHQPYPATTALALLLKNQTRIAEATALIDMATRTGKVRISGETPNSQTTILVVDDPRFGLHLKNVFHLESPRRFDAFCRALAHPSIAGRWHSMMVEPADREQLLWVHAADYIARLEKTAGRQLVTLDMDTQTTEHSWEVACLAVGGVFRLMDGICSGRASRGVAAVRPPGHHAEPDQAMGFCLLNNAALAARYLQKMHGLKRVMIIDLDAHHGNGTQTAFYDDASVLYLSTHGYPAYPGTGSLGEIGQGPGKGFTVNIPMDKGAGDRAFEAVFRRIVDPLTHAFGPEFIVVSLGFDLYLHDRLGGMKVTPEGYGMLTRMLLRMATRVCGGRIAFILEGGYSVKGIEVCGLRFLQELCNTDPDAGTEEERRNPRSAFVPAVIAKVISVQKPFWPQLF